MASEKTYFDGDIPGFFGVLHTWGRQIQYHPHIHYIVSDGAFSSLDYSFHSSNINFYSTKKENGTNPVLGLSVSYGIIKKHDGTISVKNIKESGCEFVITLPSLCN